MRGEPGERRLPPFSPDSLSTPQGEGKARGALVSKAEPGRTRAEKPQGLGEEAGGAPSPAVFQNQDDTDSRG